MNGLSGFKIEDPKRFGVCIRKLHFVKPRGTVKECHIAVVSHMAVSYMSNQEESILCMRRKAIDDSRGMLSQTTYVHLASCRSEPMLPGWSPNSSALLISRSFRCGLDAT